MLRASLWSIAVLALQGKPAQISWLNDLKQAQFEARQTGKPLFIVFR